MLQIKPLLRAGYFLKYTLAYFSNNTIDNLSGIFEEEKTLFCVFICTDSTVCNSESIGSENGIINVIRVFITQ